MNFKTTRQNRKCPPRRAFRRKVIGKRNRRWVVRLNEVIRIRWYPDSECTGNITIRKEDTHSVMNDSRKKSTRLSPKSNIPKVYSRVATVCVDYYPETRLFDRSKTARHISDHATRINTSFSSSNSFTCNHLKNLKPLIDSMLGRSADKEHGRTGLFVKKNLYQLEPKPDTLWL